MQDEYFADFFVAFGTAHRDATGTYIKYGYLEEGLRPLGMRPSLTGHVFDYR
jgi:hypothetical protein